MIVKTTDAELIRSIVTLPELWATVAEDGMGSAGWSPNMDSGWFLAMDGADIIGLYSVAANNCVTLEIHPFILKAFRGRAAYASGAQILEWLMLNTKYEKVVCSIPVIYKNVKLFAMRCGFREEGINRQSYLKNGKIHDQWMLGITRGEI